MCSDESRPEGVGPTRTGDVRDLYFARSMPVHRLVPRPASTSASIVWEAPDVQKAGVGIRIAGPRDGGEPRYHVQGEVYFRQ